MHQIGALEHRIEVQQATATRDAANQEMRTYTNFAWGWAQIDEVSARQMTAADITKVQNTYTLIIRYIPGLTAAMRIRAGTRFFDIKHVRDYKQKKEKQIVSVTEVF